MNSTDLLAAASPVDAATMLRRVAERYRQDAADIAAMWQDNGAGKIWAELADGLDALADKTERRWAKL